MSDLDIIKEIKALRKEIRELKALMAEPGAISSMAPEVTLTPKQVMNDYNMTSGELRYMRIKNPDIIRTVGDTEVDKLGRSMRRKLRYSKNEIDKLIKKPI